MIDQILTNEYFLLALTFGIYQGARCCSAARGPSCSTLYS